MSKNVKENFLLEKDDYSEFVYFQNEQLKNTLYNMQTIMDKKVVKEFLVSEIRNLSIIEQQIISLYYIENLNLHEIGEVLEIAECRIIKVIKMIVKTFRNKLKINFNIDSQKIGSVIKFSENLERNKITNLKNSELLIKDINFKIYDRKVTEFTVLVFEVLNLSNINRNLNHKFGEKVMIQTVNTAQRIFEDCDIYLLHTNEIAIITENMTIRETYEKGKLVLKEYCDPVTIDGVSINIKMNCGIVAYPSSGRSGDILFKNMGMALSLCDDNSGTISLYDEKAANKICEYYKTKTKIVNAINNDELRLEYQPKYNIANNEIIGAEALLRVDSSDLNITEVIDIAEKANLINKITRWVAKKVVKQLEDWKKEGIVTKVSMNVSPKDLSNDFFLEYLVECVENSEIEPNKIEIEITERCVIENNIIINDLLNRFKQYGFEISIDDYGTGHNSLKNVLVLPFNSIKIDKFFIDNIEDKGANSLIEGIINMAKKLDIGVVAEGVETETQYLILQNMGCDMIQGYYFSKPISPGVFKTTLIPAPFNVI